MVIRKIIHNGNLRKILSYNLVSHSQNLIIQKTDFFHALNIIFFFNKSQIFQSNDSNFKLKFYITLIITQVLLTLDVNKNLLHEIDIIK